MSQLPTEPRPDQQNQQYEQLGRSPQAAPIAPVYVQQQPKDPDTAFILEIIGGFMGFLGVGHFYAGLTNDGLIRLIAWWVVLGISWIAAFLLSTIAIGCLCIPPIVIVQAAVPIWSALQLKKNMQMRLPPLG